MKNIKNRILSSILILSAISFSSCVDKFAVGDAFLEKQPGVDVTLDTIFSNSEYARMYLWDAYKGLYHGHSVYHTMGWANMTEALSDVCHCVVGWSSMVDAYYSGTHSEAGNGGWCRDKFAFMDTSERRGIWSTVRKCWQFIENVDRVEGMTDIEKARLKAEAKLIIASRYYDALCHFGGLPLVDHSYIPTDEFTGGYVSGIVGEGEFVPGRATVEQTVTFIDNLIQQVIDEPNLPFAISDYLNEGGRLTKGGAYALRAKLWIYSASPLFNDDAPYRQYDAVPSIPAGLGDDVDPILRVWLGGYKAEYWQKALDACEAFFNANTAAGNPFEMVQPLGNTENDYREAYRAAYYYRETKEKIIEVRGEGNNMSDGEYLLEWGANIPGNISHSGGHAPTVEWFNMFPWADGKNFDGQRVYNTNNEENLDIFEGRDPRLYESMLVPQRNIDNHYNTYQDKTIDLWQGGDIITGNWWFTGGYMAHGFGEYKWVLDYYDMANQRYSWPYIRMADMHLLYAEALAQNNRFDEAIAEVDKVRARVGLPSLKVNTGLDLNNKQTLIDEILRERACELAMENSRTMDLIRYKRTDIFSKELHRMNIYAKDPATGEKTETPYSKMNGVWPDFIYEVQSISQYQRAWWNENGWDNKWLLSPLSREEINKGYGLTQNPGW